jgi:hypothetical protein
LTGDEFLTVVKGTIMHLTTQALLDPSTGKWFGVILIHEDNGKVTTLHESENQHRQRGRAEEEVIKMIKDAYGKAIDGF